MKRQKNNKKISFKGKDFFGIDVHKKLGISDITGCLLNLLP